MSTVGFKAKNHPQQVATRGALNEIDDRRTTDETFDECRQLAGVDIFDLDAAATSDSSRGCQFYDIESDGLESDWFGEVWCNPPYSDLASWVTKAEQSIDGCDVIAMLLPANRTEQPWWQDSIEQPRRHNVLDVYFLARRRRFDRPGWTKPAKGDRPPFGLCLVVWRAA
jgi:phage N-6-adenine-methyltransferase